MTYHAIYRTKKTHILYGPQPNSKKWTGFCKYYYNIVYITKVFADIINTRLTPVNFLSSNSVREIDLLFIPDDNDFNPAVV